jgi:hypothetical protein
MYLVLTFDALELRPSSRWMSDQGLSPGASAVGARKPERAGIDRCRSARERRAPAVDMKLEVVVVPVSDIDAAKQSTRVWGGGWTRTSEPARPVACN